MNMDIESFVNELEGADAQVITDYLNVVRAQEPSLLFVLSPTYPKILHEEEDLQGGNGKYILNLLFNLAKATQVYPQCYLLRGIEKEAQPSQGGAFADVYKGKHGTQPLCIKVIRVFGHEDRVQFLRVRFTNLCVHGLRTTLKTTTIRHVSKN